MKKLSLALVLLVVALVAAFAAEPSISGSFSTHYAFPGNNSQLANIGRLRLKAEIPVGDYVNFVMDLKDDKNTNNFFRFTQVYATTDISGALGIDPIGLTLTVGNFDQWMSNWNSATTANRSRFVETWRIGGVDDIKPKHEASTTPATLDTKATFMGGATPDVGLDIGILEYVTLMTYASFDKGDFQYKFGLKLGKVVDGLNFIASYSGESTGKDSYIKAEAGYELSLPGDITITIPASFMYVLKYGGDDGFKDKSILWASGVKFSGLGITFNVGVGSEKDAPAPGTLDVNLAYSIAGFSVFVNPWMSLNGAEDLLEAVDFGVSYGFADTMIYLGYVVDLGNKQDIAVLPDGDSSRHQINGGGLYIATKISF